MEKGEDDRPAIRRPLQESVWVTEDVGRVAPRIPVIVHFSVLGRCSHLCGRRGVRHHGHLCGRYRLRRHGHLCGRCGVRRHGHLRGRCRLRRHGHLRGQCRLRRHGHLRGRCRLRRHGHLCGGCDFGTSCAARFVCRRRVWRRACASTPDQHSHHHHSQPQRAPHIADYSGLSRREGVPATPTARCQRPGRRPAPCGFVQSAGRAAAAGSAPPGS